MARERADKVAGSPADRKISGKNTGTNDFSGQEARDESAETDTQEKEAGEHRDLGKVNFARQHNEHNGAGRSTKVIKSDSSELHGGRVNQREGGEP